MWGVLRCVGLEHFYQINSFCQSWQTIYPVRSFQFSGFCDSAASLNAPTHLKIMQRACSQIPQKQDRIFECNASLKKHFKKNLYEKYVNENLYCLLK